MSAELDYPRPFTLLHTACASCRVSGVSVPPFDSATVRRIIEEDLGHPPDELFTFFDDKPLSAASIGQVHACTLPDGRRAVLKIQRPGVRTLFTADLRILWRIAKLAEKYGQSAGEVGVPTRHVSWLERWCTNKTAGWRPPPAAE